MSTAFLYKGHRNSYTELNTVYFWTITIKNWNQLLINDDYKVVIVESLQWLKAKGLIRIYGYVIMPNHIHLLWEQLKMNGKEFPKNSFIKYVAHKFRIKLMIENAALLEKFVVTAKDRQYNFWQRDPLAIVIFSKEMALQKLNYIHFNPLNGKWKLCNVPEGYRFSSASFYESGEDEFGLVTHLMDVY